MLRFPVHEGRPERLRKMRARKRFHAVSAISLSTLRIFGSSLAVSSFIFCGPAGSLALRKGV